jgi:hypothetical protein
MRLGEFIKSFSHNNLIRLHFKMNGGHEIVGMDWDDVSMDWEVNKQKGNFRHFIDNEVLGLIGIHFSGNDTVYPEAINIVIERFEVQPFINEVMEDQSNQESMS